MFETEVPKEYRRRVGPQPDLTGRLWPDCVGNPLSMRKAAKFGAMWPIPCSFSP